MADICSNRQCSEESIPNPKNRIRRDSPWLMEPIDLFMRFWICIRIRAGRFGSAMKAFTSGTGYELEFLVNGYDWSLIGEGLVVDVRCPW